MAAHRKFFPSYESCWFLFSCFQYVIWPLKPQKSHSSELWEVWLQQEVDRAMSDVPEMVCSPLLWEFVSSAKNASLILVLFKSSCNMRDCERDLYSSGREWMRAIECSSSSISFKVSNRKEANLYLLKHHLWQDYIPSVSSAFQPLIIRVRPL